MGNDGTIHISGDMTFSSTPGLYREFESRFQSLGPEMEINMEAVERTDSAGLALLLEWQAVAARQQCRLKISHAGDDLLRLAELCEADALLNLSAR
jgi:phospholipid transport system transporter-binding protein